MEIERELSIYELKGEKYIFAYTLPYLSVKNLKLIIPYDNNDPHYYGSYELDFSQYVKFCSLIPDLLNWNFYEYSFYIECHQK
jgi:hypothetical protein